MVALAVSAMIGVAGRPVSASRRRIWRVAVIPSITGIWASIRIRSHSPCSQAATRFGAIVDQHRFKPDLAEQGLQHQPVHLIVLGRQDAQRAVLAAARHVRHR